MLAVRHSLFQSILDLTNPIFPAYLINIFLTKLPQTAEDKGKYQTLYIP